MRRGWKFLAKKKGLLSMLLIIFLLAALPAWSSVDVYLGFMDEEVNDLLKTLIKQHPDRRVVVIERGASVASQARLFEKPLSDYRGGAPTIISTQDPVTGASLEAEIARGIKAQAEAPEYAARLRSLVMRQGAAPKTMQAGGLDPTMTIVGFNTSASGDPIVLIRSPEMGLQPDMVAAYLEPSLDALRRLGAASPERGGLHASVYGTGGAIAPSLKPGEISGVKGSVYVGARKVPGSERYLGVIAISDGKSDPSDFYRQEFTAREEAESAARKAFAAGKELPAISGPLKGKTLDASVRGIDPGGRGAVSLTLSFFGGEDMKEAGRALGLGNVNMEDYHVLNALRAMVDTFNLARLNCDPHEITPATVKRMTEWGKAERYTISAYEDAAIWGLRGTPLAEMPRSAHWKALKGMPEGELQKLAMPIRTASGELAVLDPFYAEIATNFLQDASRGEVFSSKEGGRTFYYSIVSKKITDRLTSEELKELGGIMKAKSEIIQKKAQAVLEKAKSAGTPADFEALRVPIREILLAAADMEIPDGPLRAKIGDILAKDPTARGKRDYFARTGRIRLLGAANAEATGETTKMEVWVREGKWNKNSARTLDHIIAEPILKAIEPSAGAPHIDHTLLSHAAEMGKLSGSNVDRALYKATITPGTQLTSPQRVMAENARLAGVVNAHARVGRLVQELVSAHKVERSKAERIRDLLLAPCR